MKTKEQIKAESIDFLQRKIEKLKEEQVIIQNEINNTETLLKKMVDIYEGN